MAFNRVIRSIRLEFDGDTLICRASYSDSTTDTVRGLDKINERLEELYVVKNINSFDRLINMNWVFIPAEFRDKFHERYKIENGKIVEKEITKESGQVITEEFDELFERLRAERLPEEFRNVNAMELGFHKNNLVARVTYSDKPPITFDGMPGISSIYSVLCSNMGTDSFDTLKDMDRIIISPEDEKLFKEMYYRNDFGHFHQRTIKSISLSYDGKNIKCIVHYFKGKDKKYTDLSDINGKVLSTMYKERGTTAFSKLMDMGVVTIENITKFSTRYIISNDCTIVDKTKAMDSVTSSKNDNGTIKKLILQFNDDKLEGTLIYSSGAITFLNNLSEIKSALSSLYKETDAETFDQLKRMRKVEYNGLDFDKKFERKYEIKDGLVIAEKVIEPATLNNQVENFHGELDGEQTNLEEINRHLREQKRRVSGINPWIYAEPNHEPTRYHQDIRVNEMPVMGSGGAETNKKGRVVKGLVILALGFTALYGVTACCKSVFGGKSSEDGKEKPTPKPTKYEANIDGNKYEGTFNMTDQDAINAAIKKDKPLVTNTPKPQPTPTPTKFNKTVTEATKKPEATKKVEPQKKKIEPTPKPTFHPIPGILRSDTAKTKQDKIDFMDVVTDYTSNFVSFNYENMASKKDWWTIKVISDAFNDALEHPNKMSAFATSLGKFEKGAETVKFNGQWTEVSYDELDILIRIYPTRLAQALVTEGFVSSEYHAIIEQRAEEVDEYYTNVMEGYGK